MGERIDETDPLPSPAIEAEAREMKAVEAATPGADDDDEYQMVELSELVDVPKEGDQDIGDRPAFEAAARATDAGPLLRLSPGLLPPPVRVTPTSSASLPPPPRVPSRTLPPPPRTQGGSPSTAYSAISNRLPQSRVPPPPVRRSSTPLPAPPRGPISNPPDFTISGTVPPLSKPSKNRFVRALSGKQAAAAAVFAAICAAFYFGAKRGEDTKSEPSREVAAANLLAKPQAPPETVATEPAAPTAAVLTKNGSEALTAAPPELPKMKSDSSPADRPKMAALSPSNKAELNKAELSAAAASITAKLEAPSPAVCTLNLNTIPASRVAIDGRDLGMTPKIGISVQPGTHVVMFVNEGGKKITSAQCKAGEQKTVVMRLPI